MRLRVARKVLYPKRLAQMKLAHRDGTIDRAAQRVRRYVGSLPPAWDAIKVCVTRAKSHAALMRNDIPRFLEVYETPPWLRERDGGIQLMSHHPDPPWRRLINTGRVPPPEQE